MTLAERSDGASICAGELLEAVAGRMDAEDAACRAAHWRDVAQSRAACLAEGLLTDADCDLLGIIAWDDDAPLRRKVETLLLAAERVAAVCAQRVDPEMGGVAAVCGFEKNLALVPALCAVCLGRWQLDAAFHQRLLTRGVELIGSWAEMAYGWEDAPGGLLHPSELGEFARAHAFLRSDGALRASYLELVVRLHKAHRTLAELTHDERMLSTEAQWFLDGMLYPDEDKGDDRDV